MRTRPTVFAALAACPFDSHLVLAQNKPPQATAMGFFVTSTGIGRGGESPGVSRRRTGIARRWWTAVGAGGGTWRAFLSVSPTGGKAIVNARDRIGRGPWDSAKGDRIAERLVHLLGAAPTCVRPGRQQPQQVQCPDRTWRDGVRVRRYPEPSRHPDRIPARRPRVYGRGRLHVPELDAKQRRHGTSRTLGPHGGGTLWNST